MDWQFWYYPNARPYPGLAIDRNCCLCTPDRSAPSGPLPILYLLHPIRENERNWEAGPGALRRQLEQVTVPVVIVMPYGFVAGNPRQDGASVEGPIPDAYAFRTYFASIRERVEGRFETDGARQAIAGISMGGKQALEVGLGEYGRFPVLAVFSGMLQRSRLARRQTYLNDVIDVCPVLQPGQPRPPRPLDLFFHYCGLQETREQKTSDFLEGNQGLSRLLLERGVRQPGVSDLRSPNGRHSWDCWNPQMAEFLQVLSAHWER